MRSDLRRALALLNLVTLTAGCGSREVFAPQDVDIVVVDAILVVDRPFPSLRLSRTFASDVDFTITTTGEAGATVTVSGGGVTQTYQDTGIAGYYAPSASPLVRPDTRYRLEVVTAAGEQVTAETHTPPRFGVDEWLLLDDAGTSIDRRLATFEEAGDDVFTRPENQLEYARGLLEARFTDERNPFGYQLTVVARDPVEFVIDTSDLDEEDLDELEPVIASPVFGGEDRTFRLPWFAVFYSGRYVIRVWSLDRNWRELVDAVPELSDANGGFGGNLGDGADRPDFNVEGGIGLFGSASADSIGFTIVPPWEPLAEN